MQQDESQQENRDDEQDNCGGAAPEHRRCQYIKADGKSCRDWAVRDQRFCYRHGVYLHATSGRGIDVPLLEDESSIVLVLSETLRALALGAIPVNNGRMLLEGCRLAHTIQMEKLHAAKLRLRLRQMMMQEEAPPEERRQRDSEARTGSPQPNQERRAPSQVRSPEPIQECSVPPSEQPGAESRKREPESPEPNRKLGAVGPKPVAASSAPSSAQELARARSEMPDRFDPHSEEEQGQVLAARAAPFDELMEEEALAVGGR